MVKEKVFSTRKSIQRAAGSRGIGKQWQIKLKDKDYSWANKMERVCIIREGLPYETLEVISERGNLPVKQILNILQMPQTTYNKKKRDNELLSGRDSELLMVLIELLDFGIDVFNNEKDKFLRWLKKPNTSLGGVAPESLFDSLTGIQEVKNSLNRLEYGNMA